MNRYTTASRSREIGMYVVAAAFMFPIYIMVASSLKTLPEMQAAPLAAPSSWQWSNFADAWTQGGFGEALTTSSIVTATSIALLVLFGSMVSFVLARRVGTMSYGLYLLFLIGIILPFQLGLIPVYQLVRDLGLLGTRSSLILYYAGLQMPLTVFLFTGFMRTLPVDYEHAARVDGASSWQAYWHIVLPLIRPVTGTVVVLNIVQIWNDFLVPLLFVSGSERRTVTVAVFSFTGQYGSQWPLLFAGMIIATAPVAITYVFLAQRVMRAFGSGLKG
jgi:raffinose/stachyose/melibiose transport system permease protein